jgi:membrane protease YdiL (CAAX protease family)
VRDQADSALADTPRPAEAAAQGRTHRWGFGAFLISFATLVFAAVMIGAIAHVDSPTPGITVPVAVIGTTVPPLLAAGVAILFTVFRGNGPRIDLRWSFRWDDIRVGVRFGLIGLVCTTVAAFLWTKIVGEENATSALGKLVENQHLPLVAAIAMFLFVWLIGPVCEEIIYRGLLWGALERLNWGRWVVFGLTTVIFAVSHLEPLRTSLLLVIGIPIGLARLVTGKLGASIVAHQINNFLPALAVLLMGFGVMPA